MKYTSISFKLAAAGAVALALAACGGGSDAPVAQGVAANTTLAASATTLNSVPNVGFNFANGVADLGTTAPTTITFANNTANAAKPSFAISSGGDTATGETTFGSCHFTVTSSTFPAGHPLALGQTVTVNPCNLSVGTAGALANGVATSRTAALVLGAASSAGASVTVGVSASGGLTLNGNMVSTVTLTPVTGS